MSEPYGQQPGQQPVPWEQTTSAYPAPAQPQYGPPQYQQYQPYPPGYGYAPYPIAAPTNGVGTAGFVCGLVGLVLFWLPFVGLILSLLGAILGGAGMSSGRKTGASTGLAVAGLVLGIVGLIPAVLIIVALAGSG